jgi:hypothetical protein
MAGRMSLGQRDGLVDFGLPGGDLGRVLLLVDLLGQFLIRPHEQLKVGVGGLDHAEIGSTTSSPAAGEASPASVTESSRDCQFVPLISFPALDPAGKADVSG